MEKKTKKLLTFGIIVLVLFLSIFFPLFFIIKQNYNKNQYLYPNPLWIGSKLSDMVVENDSNIHFCLSESKNSGDTNIIYVELDLKNYLFTPIPRFSDSTFAFFNQIKIKLDSLENPVIYLQTQSSFFIPLGELLTIQNNSWETHSAFKDINENVSEFARAAVLDWEFNDSGLIDIAFLYNPYGWFYNDQLPKTLTPTIYNETTTEVTFLSEIFSKVQTFDSSIPGDFKIINSNVVLLWERYEGVENYRPYLAVNWFNETWQLYNINFDCSTVRPISILQDSNSFEIFTYSPGFIDNSSKIFLTRFVNSSYFETETIAEFQANIIFYQDSIFKTADGNYFFLYNKRTFESSMQTDLYLSYYDGHSIVETQLTDTPNFVEYYAHAELGEEYLHIAWTQFDLPDDNLLERETGKIFYNRIKIADIVERDINMHMAINNEHIFNSLNPSNISSLSYHQQIFFAFDLKIVCLMNIYIQKQEVLEYDFCD